MSLKIVYKDFKSNYAAIGIFLLILLLSLSHIIFILNEGTKTNWLKFEIFLGLSMIYLIFKVSSTLFEGKIAMEIGDDGIKDYYVFGKDIIIPWDEIVNVEIKGKSSLEKMVILMNNPELYCEMLDGMKNQIAKRNLKKYGSPFVLSLSCYKISVYDLKKLISTPSSSVD